MIDNYPFIKCLHPVRITNSLTGEPLDVPCGHCVSCLQQKSGLNALKCDLESSSCNYTMFVTLTYDDDNVPLVRVSRSSDGCFEFRYNSPRLLLYPKNRKLIDYFLPNHITDDNLNLLLNKFNVNGYIPVLYKPDLQNFLKRLRKYIYTYYNHEQIRYYSVGEYGPVHFRPHYHLLLFFNSKELASNFNEVLSKTWKYGRFDSSLSNGKCSSYVAGYVNSTVSVPSILKINAFRPFSSHSFFLGMANFERYRSELYKGQFANFVRQGFIKNGKYKEFNVWSQAVRYFFPKCKGFSALSPTERFQRYTLYKLAVSWLETTSPLKQAKIIFRRLEINLNYWCTQSGLFIYFASEYCKCSYISYERKKRLIAQFASELALSKHFLLTVCENSSPLEIERKIKIIDDFYKYRELQQMNSQYRFMEEYYKNHDLSDLDIFYDNLVNDYDDIKDTCKAIGVPFENVICSWKNTDFTKHPLYSAFCTDRYENYNKSIKHKVLNDKNKIFNDM